MDKRTIIIAVALAAPLIAMVVAAQAPPAQPLPPREHTAKQGGLSTPPAKPAAQGKPAPWAPARDVEEARERARKRLAQLEAMTQEQWEKEQEGIKKRQQRNKQMQQQGAPKRPEQKQQAPAAAPNMLRPGRAQ